MNPSQSKAAIFFSCLGHLYIHLFTAVFFVIVLALEQDWQLPYHELIKSWTLASILLGVVALPAGLLSDRIGARTMMVIFFIGMGLSSIAAGYTQTPQGLVIAMAGIGAFAAIYHPVGIPWLVRNTSSAQGKALGFNGIFGSMGTASAALVAGYLIDIASWRMAFIVPGVVSVVTGVWLWVMVVTNRVVEGSGAATKKTSTSHHDFIRAGAILLTCMFLAGMVYHSTQTALPKVFDLRRDGLIGDSTFGVGLLVATVYAIAGIMQIIGGHLADRYPLKLVYLGTLIIQIPLLYLASSAGGLVLMMTATLMVMSGVAALPAENMLLARYTPAHRHGLMFGLKFVLGFGAAPLALQLVSYYDKHSAGVQNIFVLLSVLALCAWGIAMLLPRAKFAPIPAGVGD